MGYRDVRVIVVTSYTDFFQGVSTNLSQSTDIESVVRVNSLIEVDSWIIRNKSNILLLDIDRGVASYPYLKRLLEKHKLHVILTAQSQLLVSSLLQGGVRDFVQKPKTIDRMQLQNYTDALLIIIKRYTASSPQLNYIGMQRTVDTNTKIVAIASSTGGTEAIERILKGLTANIPPILIVQHMPSGFTKFFADRLNSIYPMEIKEAQNNDYVQRGLVLIAPADQHMTLVRRSSKLMVECYRGQKIHGVMPAADVLFDSIAPLMRNKVLGIVLTGMGSDGAKGLLKMHLTGAKTIGQDPATCVVYGMPKVAFEIGALDKQLPIDQISDAIVQFANS